ncbi:sugar ABC transporter ATP-binding protein [Tepidanaerobacter syntrophicus]|uniref:Ribose transport system ATP-binding protein n=1 Tax=Tepidanaerobacter syntrophicus TaxID=224999 RepID=A0A0U9HIA7_9FIRM|nr:sugar ABC transporter ATP-binding protein [Tepidanaerobacter syntrophicus]GAQ25020.1 ribose transport system ATP-binding protein [Tepidanaerobacter syntrophicus]GLI20243.1 D-ribose transporter ATP-binding protein [Tepidanaerobacter syntrophicus]
MIVEMKNIIKSFGSNKVLKNVSFTIKGGEICALIGENGAGKSTLMNILGGVCKIDSGKIYLDGKEVEFESPAESLNAGIAFIHQELNLINDLPVYENMFLGRELKNKRGTLDLERMVYETEKVFREMNVDLDPKIMVRDLDTSYKQIVEICRAMMMNASIIIMDEPTTSLTEPEIERVFKMMRTLKERGVGIIFISHKLNEVMEICERYIVLRDGCLVAEGNVSDVTTDDLARFMVGYDVRTEQLSRKRKLGKEILRLEGLTHEKAYRNISLSVRAGEILGVTGLLGDGRSELFQSVFGAESILDGKIFLEGKEIKIFSTTQALHIGIGYLPGNRKENGIIKDMNVLENASIVTWPLFAKRGVIDWPRHINIFNRQIKELRIKLGKISDSINSLSGGNQQKVVLAKWLSANPKVLVLDNPTQGVDVGAKEDIYDIILNLADENIAVIVLSSEAQEIVRICDRAIVMYHGAIQGEVFGKTMNEHDIMRLATGGRLE